MVYGDIFYIFVKWVNICIFVLNYVDVVGGVEVVDIYLMMIDYIVVNVENMDEWVDFYLWVFGFDEMVYFDIDIGWSLLMSKVVGIIDGYICLFINEFFFENL